MESSIYSDFLKAFGISEFNAISQPISKTFGIVWLLTFTLFAITIVLLIAKSNYWWIFREGYNQNGNPV